MRVGPTPQNGGSLHQGAVRQWAANPGNLVEDPKKSLAYDDSRWEVDTRKAVLTSSNFPPSPPKKYANKVAW